VGAAFQPQRSRLKAYPTNKNVLADKVAPRAMAGLKRVNASTIF
jgi:hypothetical protein